MTRSAPGEKFPEVVEPPELERRRALWRAIFEADAALRRDEFAAKAAAREVEWCRSDVETAREQRAVEQKYARENAARQAEVAQARADADETVEEARANAEACEARTEEKMVALHTRHTEMCAEFDKKDRKMQYELARSQWAEDRASCVQQHAAKVWGAAWQTEDRPAPKVFSLVGKSVSEVRGMSGEVSQEGTGTEERVALNQLKCTSHFFSRLYPGHTALRGPSPATRLCSHVLR